MARPRSKSGTLPEHLYARQGKRSTSYYTRTAGGGYLALGSDLALAKQRLAELREGRPAAGTVADLCRQYIFDARSRTASGARTALSPRTVEDYEYSLGGRIAAVFGAMPPDSVTPAHIAQYLHRGELAGHPVRANREVAALGSAFNFGMRVGLAARNPCRGVRRNLERPRTRLVTAAEANGILTLARTLGGSMHMVALIAAAVAITGRRRAELLNLTRAAITPDGLRVRDCKTKGREAAREYLVAWSPLLRDLLAEAAAIPRGSKRTPVASLYLFPARDGQPYRDQAFKLLWNRLQKAWAAQGGERFTAHDLRALYVSAKIEAGESPNTHRHAATAERVYDRRRLINVKPLG
jgi:integrase